MNQFAVDVHAGLSQPNKSLPSKYFYDSVGDDLFVQIMALPEYYLTRAEMEIFTLQASAIVSAFEFEKDTHFELIELGAGDGSKTEKLLTELLAQGYKFEYLPVDISSNALAGLEKSLGDALPALKVTVQQGDYLETLDRLKQHQVPKVVLFLGSNMGNMPDQDATRFINEIGSNLNVGDKLLLGLDLIKSAELVLPAYDDPQGLTKRFNLNLLHRINAELGADFILEEFEHVAEYNESEGIARSFLRSRVDQTVSIASSGQRYHFKAGEVIATEISRKYSTALLNELIQGTHFYVRNQFTDQNAYFMDYLLERIELEQ